MRKTLLIILIIAGFCVPLAWAQSNQTVGNGDTTETVNFPAGGCTYNWTNSNPSIGLPASGTGNIPSFTAVNNTNSPVTTTITATPAGGLAYIPNSGDGTVSVVNLATNTVESTIQVGSFPFAVAASPDGTRVFITNEYSNTVSVISTATNTVIATVPVGSYPDGVAVSPDGTLAYVSNYSNNENIGPNTVSVIKTSTNSVVSTITVGPEPLGIAVSPNGVFMYVANSFSNTVSVIQAATNAVSANITVGDHPFGICFSPDGSRVYVANHDAQSVSVINTATNNVIAAISVGISPYGVCSSIDGTHVYVTNLNDNTVSVINTASNSVTTTIPVGPLPYGICASPDGNNIYVVTRGNNSISTINTTTNTISAGTVVGSAPYAFGNFFVGNGCNGSPVTFTITVNPTVTPDTIQATLATGNITACAGTTSVSPNIQQFTISGSGLTNNITATAPANFQVSLSAGSGYGSTVALNQTNGSVDSTIIYVCSSASAPTGSISGNVILSSTGATSQNVAVSGIVNALPTVNTVPNQTVTNGTATTPVNFTGTGNTFTWTNDTPGIGLPASGTGNIPSFTAVNNTNSPVTATITVTPQPDGFAYVPNFNSNNVSVINTSTNKVVSTIPVGTGPWSTAVSADGSRVYIVNNTSNNVSVINAATNSVIATIAVGKYPIGIAITPDGKYVYVANDLSATVSVINTASNMVVANISVNSNPFNLTISPDGTRIYVTHGTSEIDVISTATNQVVNNLTIPATYTASDIAMSPDGNIAYITLENNNELIGFNVTTGQVVYSIGTGTQPWEVAISPDGSHLYVGCQVAVNYLTVVNLLTTFGSQIPLGTDAQEGVSISPDGSRVYVANLNAGTVSVINTATSAVIATVPVGTGPYAFGNFVSAGNGCSGMPVTFTVTVNPTLPPSITTTAAAGYITACEGTASSSPNIQQITVSGTDLSNNITVTAPANFEVSLSEGSGYGSSVTINPTNGSAESTVVYVCSSASAPAGAISGNVVLSSTGAASQSVAVSGIVNALPTVNTIPNQTVKNGTATTAINFTGTGDTFTWTNDTPGIGLPASGTGNIPSFTAVNTTNSPVTATITATSANAGFSYVVDDGVNEVSVINNATNAVTATIPVGNEPDAIAISPNGLRAYVTNYKDGTVSVINTVANTVEFTINAGNYPVGIVTSPDGSQLYVACSGGIISVISTTSNTITASISIAGVINNLSISPDGKLLYVNVSSSGAIIIINTATNTINPTNTDGPYGSGSYVATSSDGSRVYIIGASNGLEIINPVTNTILSTIPLNGTAAGIAVSPDDSYVYITDELANSVWVVNTSAYKIVATIPVGNNPREVSISTDGKNVYVANISSNTISVINTATNTVSATIKVGADPDAVGIVGNTGCNSNPTSFTITVNPALSPAITASQATGNIVACEGTASSSPDIQQFTVSGSGLTTNISATTSSNFEISLAADGGYGNTLTLSQTDGSVNNTIIYVRSTAADPAKSITGEVVLSSTGALSQSVAVSGTVNALPTVDKVPDQVITGGELTKAINFTGTAASYTWTNTVPAIGLPASGNGDISAFTAINTGDDPLIATITVTPEPTMCSGVSIVFTITVNPPGNNIVTSIIIPNTFTPNGDGINDTWEIKSLQNYPNCTVNIYNRWGEKLYSSIGYSVPWDGTYKGANLPTGTYYYIINLKNGIKAIAGWVAIVK